MLLTKKSKIYVAGHSGLVGSSVIRILIAKGYKNLIFKSRKQLDLTKQESVLKFFKNNKIEFVIIAAAKVGGIYANNKYRADFIYENLAIQNNIIYSAFISGVKNLIFLGSSCIYPKNCKQPIKEDFLLSGKLESTNEPYAIAKIAGIKLCESFNSQYKTNYKCLMPCNLFGPNDNFNLKNSHFFPALLKKIYIAKNKNYKKLEIWGSGSPKRELMYVDDLANACIFFLKKKTKETLINIGSSTEYSIKEYAKFIMKQLNVKLKIFYNISQPDGVKRKLLDSSLARSYGWKSAYDLKKGFKLYYDDFLKKNSNTQ